MATYKFSFMEAGIYRQEKATTKLEAIREMEISCDKCYYRFNCNKTLVQNLQSASRTS